MKSRRVARWLRVLADKVDAPPPPWAQRVRVGYGDGFATTPSGTTQATGVTWTWASGDSLGRNDG